MKLHGFIKVKKAENPVTYSGQALINGRMENTHRGLEMGISCDNKRKFENKLIFFEKGRRSEKTDDKRNDKCKK